MTTDQAVEFLGLSEMVKTSGCDYCDDPTGRRFVKYFEFEWVNTENERNIRSINTGNDWSSKYDQMDGVDTTINGVQTKIQYYCCEKCLSHHANILYNNIVRMVGDSNSWRDKYFNRR